MDWYATIKRFHERKLWDDSRVADAVVAKKITEEEYKVITGKDYVAAE